MMLRPLAVPAVLAAFAVLPALPAPADAQILKRIKQRAEQAAESEVLNQVDRKVRAEVRCAFDDTGCIERARKSDADVVLVDDRGEVITDRAGKPVSDPAEAARTATVKPGEGAWANYDFVPGDRILVYEDFTRDKVGDFPRRFDLVQGNFEIVEWQGNRFLRATANGTLAIPLPKTLPERFTIETEVNLRHGNAYLRVAPGTAYHGKRNYAGTVVTVEHSRAGVRAFRDRGPESLVKVATARVHDNVAPLRIMADGEYMKVYLGEQRVANAPNAVFPRSDTIYVSVAWAAEDHPVLMGPVRIAEGGLDLYDRLARDGRVATQGIFFSTGSDRIRPESTPTLTEIAAMLAAHPDLRLRIEGHTDNVGDEASNRALSDRRAAAVKAWLTAEAEVAAGRLETAGLGEDQPAASNDTPEGRQENRRVELVRLDG